MDWALAIKKNQEDLVAVVALLFAQAGLTPEFTPTRLARSVHRAIMRLLRPAESAARRLIVIAACGLKPRCAYQRSGNPDFEKFGMTTHRQPAFRLIDARKRFGTGSFRMIAKTPPRISVPGVSEPRFEADCKTIANDGFLDAAGLIGRLKALQIALSDLPRQAHRLARYQAKMRNQADGARIKLPPLRPGRPPGLSKRRRHDVDDILTECDLLARDRMQNARAPTPGLKPLI